MIVAPLLAATVIAAPPIDFSIRAKPKAQFSYVHEDEATIRIQGAGKTFDVKVTEQAVAKEIVERTGKGGRVEAFRREYGAHTKKQTFIGVAAEPLATSEPGRYDKATQKFERSPRGYREVLSLPGGKEIKSERGFVLGQDLLPTRKLAPGDKETISDGKRLSAMFGRFGSNGFTEPLVYEIVDVQQKGSAKVVEVVGRARMNASVAVPNHGKLPIDMTVEIRTKYDATHGFVMKSKVTGTGTGNREAWRFSVRFVAETSRKKM